MLNQTSARFATRETGKAFRRGQDRQQPYDALADVPIPRLPRAAVLPCAPALGVARLRLANGAAWAPVLQYRGSLFAGRWAHAWNPYTPFGQAPSLIRPLFRHLGLIPSKPRLRFRPGGLLMVATFKCMQCGGIWAPPTRDPPISCPLCESLEWDKPSRRDSPVPRQVLCVQASAVGAHIFTSRDEVVR